MSSSARLRERAVVASRHDALAAEVARVRARLEWWSVVAAGETATAGEGPADGSGDAAAVDSPVAEVARAFGLSSFERDILALTAAVELDGEVAAIVAEAQAGDSRPTFALALAALDGPHWDAIAPGSPLRWWRLVEPGAGPTLASSPMRLDERVLHHLTGLPAVDERLSGVVRIALAEQELSPSQQAVADDLVATVLGLGSPALVVLDGDDLDGRSAVTRRFAFGLGGLPFVVTAPALPAPGPELALTARLIDRELVLAGGVPIIEPAVGSEAVVGELIGLLASAVVVHLGDAAPTGRDRVAVRRSVRWPTPDEQQALWLEALAAAAPPSDQPVEVVPDDLCAAIDEVAQHYRLGAASVAAIARELRARPDGRPPGGADLHRLCRRRSRVNLDGLADRIEATASWDDLVLPAGQTELLRDIARQVRHRHRVYEEWGFAGPTRRGLGVTALFSGDSGTGKTLAAEVLAAELDLDLYRIDLSAVVSKYIGETEKNLQQLFDAAESSGAILLFDEADALFAKRGEVKQAHDRYANLEVAYLLGRMESYRGLALLTTNLSGNLDKAFMRRLRFVLQFPFPDEADRALIWARMFPPGAPTKGLDTAALARLAVAGGGIRTSAGSAAFGAADDDSPITAAHVLRAAEVEYAKVERSLSDGERAALS